MGFWKLSLTALLVASFFSLASTVLTSKTHAQEKAPKKCLTAQFVALGEMNCKLTSKKLDKTAEFLPTQTLVPTITPVKKEKEEKPQSPVYSQPQFTYEPGATLSADLLFSMVNNHRAGINLPPLEQEAQICAVAYSRREEIAQEIYQGLPMHAGFYAKNLPYWATENMIYQHTEAEALNWWLNSPIHRSAIEGNYKYACGVCNGEVCNMVFTNYDPKSYAIAPTASITPSASQPPLPQVDNKLSFSASVNLTKN